MTTRSRARRWGRKRREPGIRSRGAWEGGGVGSGRCRADARPRRMGAISATRPARGRRRHRAGGRAGAGRCSGEATFLLLWPPRWDSSTQNRPVHLPRAGGPARGAWVSPGEYRGPSSGRPATAAGRGRRPREQQRGSRRNTVRGRPDRGAGGGGGAAAAPSRGERPVYPRREVAAGVHRREAPRCSPALGGPGRRTVAAPTLRSPSEPQPARPHGFRRRRLPCLPSLTGLPGCGDRASAEPPREAR